MDGGRQTLARPARSIYHRLAKRNSLPKAAGPIAIDSGGFSELSNHGQWTVPVRDYVALVRRCVDCVGNVRWAACQDWPSWPSGSSSAPRPERR